MTRSWGAADHRRRASTTRTRRSTRDTFSTTRSAYPAGTNARRSTLRQHNHNEGVFVGPNNFYNRATTRLNASHHLTDGFTVGGNFSFADTRGRLTQRGNNVNGLLLGLFRTPPNFNNLPYLDPTTGLHRSYLVPNATPETAGQTRTFDNPFFVLNS